MQIRVSLLVVISLLMGLVFPLHTLHAAPQAVPLVTITDCSDIGLTNAIAAVDPGGTIRFNCLGTSASFVIAQKTLSKSLTIDGSNSGNILPITLSGGNTNRLFVITSAAQVELRNLHMTNGNAGAAEGGAIINSGILSLSTSDILDSQASIDGGGIANYGTLVLTASRLQGNQVFGEASAQAFGGGLYSFQGVVTITASIIQSNTAQAATYAAGGGIFADTYTSPGSITILQSVIAQNRALGNGDSFFTSNNGGGGLYSNGANLSIESSTIISNATALLPGNTTSGQRGGGGIFQFGGMLLVSRSTLTGNSATTEGGGILSKNGVLTITNSTLSRNSSPLGAAELYSGNITTHINNTTIVQGDTLGIHKSNGSITAKNSIFATYCSPLFMIASQGYNIYSHSSCAEFAPLKPTDKIADPLLGPLQYNGGPTATHALLPTSPAINWGGCPAGNPPTDQRGGQRIVGVACDSGAVEFGAILPGAFVPVVLRLKSLGW